MMGYYYLHYVAHEGYDGKWGVVDKRGAFIYEPTFDTEEEAAFVADYHNGHPEAEYERDVLPAWTALQNEVKAEIASNVLVAKVVYDRYPNRQIYVEDLEELHRVIDIVFIDDPERFQCSPDYNFEDWVGKGETVVITMEYVTREFLNKLEYFECFD